MDIAIDPGALAATRRALHSVAEHVLAGDLWRTTGRIGLRRTPGGFGQPEHEAAGARRRLRVDGTSLVVLEGDVERWSPLTSLGAAARAAGTRPGAPTMVYEPETAADPDAALDLDAGAAGALADWFTFVEDALAELRRRHADRTPTLPQLWPEHFDLACSMDEVNLGGSPGDDDHDRPYLYVGPWGPRTGPFWNEPWGAALAWDELGSVDDAVAFFERGLERAAADR